MATNSPNYSEAEIAALKFGSVGRNVQISRSCAFYGIEHITLGNNVRIDAFTVMTASAEHPVRLGSFIHIGCLCYVCGSGGGVVMEDYSALSSSVLLYTSSDDYSGSGMTNPTVPEPYTTTRFGAIHLANHAIIGAHSVVLPNCRLGEGAALGALSLVVGDLAPWGVYGGIPARRLKARERKPLQMSQELEQDPRYRHLFSS